MTCLMYEQQWSTIYKNKLWPLQHLGFIFRWELHNERLSRSRGGIVHLAAMKTSRSSLRSDDASATYSINHRIDLHCKLFISLSANIFTKHFSKKRLGESVRWIWTIFPAIFIASCYHDNRPSKVNPSLMTFNSSVLLRTSSS